MAFGLVVEQRKSQPGIFHSLTHVFDPHCLRFLKARFHFYFLLVLLGGGSEVMFSNVLLDCIQYVLLSPFHISVPLSNLSSPYYINNGVDHSLTCF